MFYFCIFKANPPFLIYFLWQLGFASSYHPFLLVFHFWRYLWILFSIHRILSQMIFPENKKLLTATNWSLVCIPEAATVWQRWCGGGIGDLGNNQQWDAGVPGDCCWAFRQWNFFGNVCFTSGTTNSERRASWAFRVLDLEQPTVRRKFSKKFWVFLQSLLVCLKWSSIIFRSWSTSLWPAFLWPGWTFKQNGKNGEEDEKDRRSEFVIIDLERRCVDVGDEDCCDWLHKERGQLG